MCTKTIFLSGDQVTRDYWEREREREREREACKDKAAKEGSKFDKTDLQYDTKSLIYWVQIKIIINLGILVCILLIF